MNNAGMFSSLEGKDKNSTTIARLVLLGAHIVTLLRVRVRVGVLTLSTRLTLTHLSRQFPTRFGD